MPRFFVELDASDKAEVCSIARSRNNPKEQASVYSKKHNDRLSELEAHIRGIEGEAAAAAFVGAKLDRNATLTGDNGIDFYVGPISFQIKFNGHSWGDFYFDQPHDFKAEVGVLVVKDSECFEIAGWITHDEFLREWEWIHLSDERGDRAGVLRQKLRKPWGLQTYIRSRLTR